MSLRMLVARMRRRGWWRRGESRAARRGEEKPLSLDEQRELRASAEREWMESGFQKEGESAKL